MSVSVCVCDVCVDTYHEDLAYLAIHSHPADLRGQTKRAKNSHVFTITMVTHGVAMITDIAWLENDLRLCSRTGIFKH